MEKPTPFEAALAAMRHVLQQKGASFDALARSFFEALDHQPDDGYLRWLTPMLLAEPDLCQHNMLPAIIRELAHTETNGPHSRVGRVADVVGGHNPEHLTERQNWIRSWVLFRCGRLPRDAARSFALAMLAEPSFTRVSYCFPSDNPELAGLARSLASEFIEDPAFRQTHLRIAYNLLFLVPLAAPDQFEDLVEAICGTVDAETAVDARHPAGQAVILARHHLPYIAARKAARHRASPALVGPAQPRVLACVSGQLRGWEAAFKSWRHFGLDPSLVTYVVHTWRKIGRSDPLNFTQTYRSFGGRFQEVLRAELLAGRRKDIENQYPSLIALIGADADIEAGHLREVYGTQHVTVEDEAEEPFARWPNVDKLYHKLWATHEAARPLLSEHDLVLRIRPDISLERMPDWRDIHARSRAERRIFTDMRGSVFRGGAFGIGDQMAAGTPETMEPFAMAKPMAWDYPRDGRHFGFDRGCVGHITVYWASVHEGVAPEQFATDLGKRFVDPPFFSTQDILVAIQRDIQSRAPFELDDMFLRAIGDQPI